MRERESEREKRECEKERVRERKRERERESGREKSLIVLKTIPPSITLTKFFLAIFL